MIRPTIYPLWLEAEISPGTWDSDLNGPPAGCRTLEEALERVEDLRRSSPRWAVAFRLVDPAGAVVRAIAAA
jgi:hypothetical protein